MQIATHDNLLPKLCLGALSFALIYFGILSYYINNRLLKLYRNYIASCSLYILLKVILIDNSIKNNTWDILTDAFLWLGYIYYIKFIFKAIDPDEEKQSLPAISKYMIFSIFLVYSISTIVQIISPKNIFIAYILVGLLIIAFFSLTIYILFFLVDKFTTDLYFKFITFGCLSLVIVSLSGFIVEVVQVYPIGMSKVSFNCLALVLELIFFSHAVSLNIKKGWEDQQRYQEIILKLETEKTLIKTPTIINKEIVQIERITEEKEKELLNKLNKFEKTDKFLKQNITLASLADSLNTNTTYLSLIINKHKGKNFNVYITELRLDYIVEKLQNDPSYRRYKITHIAELSGFSSYNTFTTSFKNFTGISPSKFIELSRENRN